MRSESAWQRYWHASVPPHGLAAFRILLGTFLLFYFLWFLPHVELLFSREGVYLPVLAPDLAPAPWLAWVLYVAVLATSFLFAAGWRTAVVTPVLPLLFLHHYVVFLGGVASAHDSLIFVCLAVACLGQLDGVWALGPWRPARPVSAWAGRVLKLQLAALYLGTGVYKLGRPGWLDGEALELFFVGPDASGAARWFAGFGWPRGFYAAASWGVIVFELLAGFALYTRWGKFALALGALFHIAVAVFLRLPEFLVVLALYPLAVDPAWLSLACGGAPARGRPHRRR